MTDEEKAEKDRKFHECRQKLYDNMSKIPGAETRTIHIPENPEITQFLKDMKAFREASIEAARKDPRKIRLKAG